MKSQNEFIKETKKGSGDHLASSGKDLDYFKGKDMDGFPVIDPKAFDLPQNVEPLDEKNDEIVKNPICRRFFTLIRLIGTCVMLISLIADFAYVMK